MLGQWNRPEDLEVKQYDCGFCSHRVASGKGFRFNDPRHGHQDASIVICPNCLHPTFFDEFGRGTPGVRFGQQVGNLPDTVGKLYDEARNCVAASSPTAAVLALRKLIMNLAVDKGARPGEPFIKYVEYLADQGYLPPGGKAWVDVIRTRGNEANHEIVIMKDDDAKDLITFAEMLLKLIYEFPSKVPQARPVAGAGA